MNRIISDISLELVKKTKVTIFFFAGVDVIVIYKEYFPEVFKKSELILITPKDP